MPTNEEAGKEADAPRDDRGGEENPSNCPPRNTANRRWGLHAIAHRALNLRYCSSAACAFSVRMRAAASASAVSLTRRAAASFFRAAASARAPQSSRRPAPLPGQCAPFRAWLRRARRHASCALPRTLRVARSVPRCARPSLQLRALPSLLRVPCRVPRRGVSRRPRAEILWRASPPVAPRAYRQSATLAGRQATRTRSAGAAS